MEGNEMIYKLKIAGLSLISIMLATFSVNAGSFKLEGKPDPVMIYFNVKNDGGWVQALDEARLRMENQLGMKITHVEKIPEVATEIRPAVQKFIKRGKNIIIGSAFGYSDTFKELAEEYPNVAFLNAAGTTNNEKNLVSFYGRTYESQYLCGMIAGAMTKSNKIGFVAANPFGLVNWTVNAYLLGAQQMNPNVTMNVVFTGAWYDPVKERAAAEALVEQGIDVIGQHVDTPTPQIVAQEKGVYGTGHHRDMSEFASDATLCSSVWVWDKYLGPKIKQIADGNWEPGAWGDFLSIKEGGTDIALNDSLPADVVNKVMAERDAIINGKNIYAGPLKDQTGTIRVVAGASPSDGDLWGMDYLLEGIVGTLN
jgi:basic membrane lipoprotein Med (substrate-binding protein (PBP1-ABC) superfamily)